MIKDILIQANQKFQFGKMIESPSKYVKLTDNILYLIECTDDPSLIEAQNLINRIKTRNTYKFASEVLLDYSIKTPQLQKMTIDVCNCQESDGSPSIFPKDFEIIKKTISYCMKDQNPVDSVKFYRKRNENEAFHVRPEEVSLLIPAKFSERYIRVFVKDTKKLIKVKKAFKKYCSKFLRKKVGLVEGNFKPIQHKKSEKRSIQSKVFSPIIEKPTINSLIGVKRGLNFTDFNKPSAKKSPFKIKKMIN